MTYSSCQTINGLANSDCKIFHLDYLLKSVHIRKYVLKLVRLY
jgi:hypothetical protein